VTAPPQLDPQGGFAATFAAAAARLPQPTISVRELLALVGEQALLLCCACLAVPFLLPLAVPGTSVVFGVLLGLVGGGVALNRRAWLPERLLAHRLDSARVGRALERAIALGRRFGASVRPRLPVLTEPGTCNRFNGLVLVYAALLLMAPLPLVPLTSTLPAIGIILLAIGMAERDGVVVLLGYAALAVATAYVAVLLAGVYWAGTGLADALGRLRVH